MAVNTLTGYLLLSIDKPVEALEFITIAERIAYKLIEKNIATQNSTGQDEFVKAHSSNLNNLEVIGEDETGRSKSKRNMQEDSIGFTESMHASPREEVKKSQPTHETERRRDRSSSSNNKMNQSNKRSTNRSISREEKEDLEDETYTSRKKSRMSATLLSNFVLGITLLKNISLRFSTPGKFYEEFDQSMNQLMHVEKILFSMGSLDSTLGHEDLDANQDDSVEGTESAV